jgi:hypothetical protein
MRFSDCAGDRDSRTRLRAGLHPALEDPAEQRSVLTEAAGLAETGNPMAAALATLVLRITQ